MPIEFTIVAVAFFSTKFSQSMCHKFYLFEPICTAVLLACASAVHVIRVHAIYEKSRSVLFGLGALFAIQVAVTGVACGFYRSVPLDVGQGCIAGPKSNWVGIYWVAPTLLYTVTFALALIRSIQSLEAKPLSPWKLMLRDGLNLYAAVWVVNMVNMLFWFISKPTGPEDPIKTIVTSMAAVLTTSMTLRIVLSVRGTLASGGSFAGSTTHGSSRTTHVISTSRSNPTGISSRIPGTYTLDEIRSGVKAEGEWDNDGKSSVHEAKGVDIVNIANDPKVGDVDNRGLGVKITIDQQVEYDQAPYNRSRK